jgi:phospholipase C
MRRYSVLFLLLAGCAGGPPKGLEQIETIVVVYAENRSFDHLYGLFPGAEGIANATAEQKTQLDHDGTPLPKLPPVYIGGKPSAAFPDNRRTAHDAPPVNRRLTRCCRARSTPTTRTASRSRAARTTVRAMSNVGAWAMGSTARR